MLAWQRALIQHMLPPTYMGFGGGKKTQCNFSQNQRILSQKGGTVGRKNRFVHTGHGGEFAFRIPFNLQITKKVFFLKKGNKNERMHCAARVSVSLRRFFSSSQVFAHCHHRRMPREEMVIHGGRGDGRWRTFFWNHPQFVNPKKKNICVAQVLLQSMCL